MNFVPKERSQKTIKRLLNKYDERSKKRLQEIEKRHEQKVKK